MTGPVPSPVLQAHGARIGRQKAEAVRHAPNGLRESAARSSAHHSRVVLAMGRPSHDEFGHLTTAPAVARRLETPTWHSTRSSISPRYMSTVSTRVTRCHVCQVAQRGRPFARSSQHGDASVADRSIAQVDTRLGWLDTLHRAFGRGLSRSASVRGHRALARALRTGQELSAYGTAAFGSKMRIMFRSRAGSSKG